MPDNFTPEGHCPAPRRGFEELEIGEKFILPSRTVTDAHFSAFQMLSADNHPIHYDRPYCARQGHRNLLAHGLQVLCFTAAGAGAFPHMVGENLIGFIEVSAQFNRAVYVDDTLYPALTITNLISQNTQVSLSCARQYIIRIVISSLTANTNICCTCKKCCFAQDKRLYFPFVHSTNPIPHIM